MYEHRRQPLLHRRHFAHRMARHFLLVALLLLASLGIGMAGYIGFEHFSVIDAYLDSAMLLGGMGPVHPPVTVAGKLFAGCYALFAGVVFITSAAVVFAPLLHRILHRLHWESGADR